MVLQDTGVPLQRNVGERVATAVPKAGGDTALAG
jgi:hypothetical protein